MAAAATRLGRRVDPASAIRMMSLMLWPVADMSSLSIESVLWFLSQEGLTAP
jgi:hypothetical protein